MELPAEVLRCQVDSLRDALLKVLDTREKEAKAWFASNNAKENFSDRGVKEERLHLAAMTAASNAEKEARLLLATLKRPAAPTDEHPRLSWDGFNITGDVQSVREVRRLVEFHAARRVEAP